MALTVWLVGILAILLSYFYFINSRKSRNLPPGPLGLPIFGILLTEILNSIINSKQRFYTQLLRYSKRYGPIMSFYAGSQLMVLMSDFHDVKESLVKSVFAGRAQNKFTKWLTFGYHGLIMSEGDLWVEQRRFTLRILKDFGFGKSLSEQQIREEAGMLVKEIRSKVNNPVDTAQLFPKPVNNIISNLVFGKRFDYSDPEIEKQIVLLRKLTQISGVGTFLIVFFPALEKLAKTLPDSKSFWQSHNSLYEYMKIYVKEHKDRFNPDNEPTDFIEAFLLERWKLEKENSRKLQHFTDTQLLVAVFDLFAAGTDTTSNSLVWALVFLTLYPEWQDKLQREVLSQCGSERVPKMTDRVAMPLTQAFIDEVLRFNTILTHSVDHRVTEPVTVRGYTIPTDAMLLINIYGIHHNSELWEQPDKFKPSRFLDNKGHYKSSEYLIPFSIGKRSCLGEQLAKMELFIFLATITQHFEVELAEGSYKNLQDIIIGTDGLIHGAGEHKIIFSSLESLSAA